MMSPEERKPLDFESEEAPEDYGDFVVWFMEKYKGSINRHVMRRLIPNRYSVDDVRAYIAESMLRILKRRAAVGRPIEEPKLYFRKLIDFYCVEFQRMHGYIYCLPKRPRSVEAEQDIAQYGFVYFPSAEDGGHDQLHELAYVDAGVSEPEEYYYDGYAIKGEDPDSGSAVWEKMMKMVLPDDRKVLECVFRMNMSVPEASRHLNIAVSTAYQRTSRGVRAISGTLLSYVEMSGPSHHIFDQIEKLNDDDVDIMQFYDV